MLGLAASLQKGGASLLTYVKDNLKLYLDFKSNKSDTLKFPSEGSTSFDGSDDFIDCGELDSNTFTNSYDGGLTMSAWFKTDVIEYAGIMELGLNSSSNFGTAHILVHGDNSQVGLRINNASTSVFSGSNTIVAGQWYHVTTVYDGANNKIKIYLDGEFKAEATASNALDFNSNGRKITLGAYKSSFKLDGQLTNAGIWSRVLEPEEIQSIMNKSYSQLKGVEKTSLVMWQSLDSTGLGSELITNSADREFTSDTGFWNLSGATITGNKLEFSNNNALNRRDGLLTNSVVYEVVVDVSDYTSGSFKIYAHGTQSSSISSQGIHTITITAGTSNDIFGFNCTAFTGSINSVSVKEKNALIDSEGSNNGTTIGATTTTSVYGGNAPILPRAVDVAKEGQADAIGDGSASFTASNADYVQISDNDIFTGNGGFSVTCWIKFDSISGNTCIIAKHADYGDVDNAGEFYIINDDGACEFVVVDDTNSASKGQIKTGVFAVNTWYHLACTYNGGTPNSSCKIYINGIFQTQSDNATGSGFASINNTTQPLTIGAFADEGEPHDGNISAVGFWQGALTQAQVQSVMESTSYSKIPADVKSTLGSELFPTSNSSYDVSTSVWSKDTASPPILTYGDSSNGSASISVSDITINTSKLYKITFTVSGLSSGTADITFNSALNEEYRAEESFTNGTFTRYFTTPSSHNGGFRFRSDTGSGSSFNVSDYSLKEVTNDIVAYYPLDGSSSDTSNGAGITNDVTTGETLSSELVGDASFDTGGSANISISNTTDTQVTGGALVYTDGSASDVTFLKSSANILTSGDLHKLVFTIADADGSGARIAFSFMPTSVPNYDHTNYLDGTHTIYFNADQSNALMNISAASPSFKMTDVSIKEVTSNTGVLK